MAHPYSHAREMKPGHKRAKEMAKHFKTGGAVKLATGGAVKLKTGGAAPELKAEGGAAGGRLDKRARGGKTKHKGHHTHINIMVAPKGGDASGGPDLGAGAGGAPPVAAPPMVPKGPMGPPPGALGAGPPGMPPGMPPPGAGGPPKPPGMMKRGGKAPSGLSSKADIKGWGKRASSNTKYAEGGSIAPFKPPHLKGGAGGAQGRLDKEKSYGLKPHKGG